MPVETADAVRSRPRVARWSRRAGGRSRGPGRVLIAVTICAVVLSACGSSSSPSAVSPRLRVSGTASRDCPGEQLTCEQLVALGLTYPYPRQTGSYLYVDGVAYPYVNLGHRSLANASVRVAGAVLSVRELLGRLGLAKQAYAARTPVIAYGSNANVDALTRKFLAPAFSGPVVIPVIKGTLDGFDVAWSPEFVFNGAMPATIVGSPGTSVSVWVTWLDAAELKRMNATEGVGTLYSYGFIAGARLRLPGPEVTRPAIYVDCFGAVRSRGQILAIRSVPARNRHFVAVNSAEALSRVVATIGWHGSVFDLLLDNVRFPQRRDRRSKLLERLGAQLPEPRYEAAYRCAPR